MLEKHGCYVLDTLAPGGLLPIGTQVRIKSQKVIEEVHDRDLEFPFSFIDEMDRYCGQIATITSAHWVEYYNGEDFSLGKYRLNIDNQEFSWSVDMFDWSWRRKITMENE